MRGAIEVKPSSAHKSIGGARVLHVARTAKPDFTNKSSATSTATNRVSSRASP
jgi:hypothetical protein